MSGKRHWRNSYPREADLEANDLLARDEIAGPAVSAAGKPTRDPLWTPEQVARRLNVSPDWVSDRSSRKEPSLPVIIIAKQREGLVGAEDVTLNPNRLAFFDRERQK